MRHVVITGVSRGLGRAMAEEFTRLGHVVDGCARSAEAVDELARTIGSPHHFERVDISIPAEVDRWAAGVLSRSGPPDLLFNNAGVINAPAPLWEVPREEFSGLIDINLKGTVYVIQAFVPAMIKSGRGVVVNFSSGWGRSASAEVAPYCASKFAVEGLTRSLAAELPSGLSAVAFNPGVVDTAMLRRSSGGGGGEGSRRAAARWAARAVPFLLELGRKDNGKPVDAP